MLRLGENTRRLARIGIAAGAMVIVIVLAAVVLLPAMVPASQMRHAAILAVAGTSERDMTISGDPVLRLLPSPRVELHEVAFALPHGQSLEVKAVVSRIGLWPLLFGRISVSEVTLESPTLVVTDNRVMPDLGIEPFLAATGGPHVRVADGTIVWRDDSGHIRERISGIFGRFDRIAGGRGFAVNAILDWRNAALEARLDVDDAKAFLTGALTPIRASLASGTAGIRFHGQASLAPRLAAEGTLNADAGSLRAVLHWIGASVPTDGGFGAFALSSGLSLAGDTLSFSNSTLDLDGNRAEGGLLVNLAGARPLIQGTLAADRINLNPYGLQPFVSDDGRDWSRRTLDVSRLDGFDLDLRLSAGQITADTATFTTVAISAVLSNGRLELALGQARSWNGLLRGTATLSPYWSGHNPDGTGLVLKAEAECTSIALESALRDIAGFGNLEGAGNLAFKFQGEGRTPQEIARSLSGDVVMTSNGGALVGFDVVQVLRRIERRPLSGTANPRGGRTPFNDFLARASLRNGVAVLDSFRIESKQVRLDLGGVIDVAQRTFDLAGTAALNARPRTAETDEGGLPFLIQGPWVAPRIMADPLSLLERSDAAQPLLEAARDRKAGTVIQDMIEKLLAPAEVPAPTASSNSAD